MLREKVLLFTVIIILYTGCPHQTPRTIIDLIDYYSQAKPIDGFESETEQNGLVQQVSIGNNTRQSLCFLKPGTLKMYLVCPETANLELFLGIDQCQEQQPGHDLVQFTIHVETDNQSPLQTHSFEPDISSLRRKWYPISVNLGDVAGELICLSFTWFDGNDLPGYRLAVGSMTISGFQQGPDISRTLSPPPASTSTRDKTPYKDENLIIILVDTLRADSTGFGGHHLVNTPQLDWLSKRGALFPETYSSTSWTRPAVATLFTGTSPLVHQAITRKDKLTSSIPTLAESFKKSGYATYGLIANGNVSTDYGFGRGFDNYNLIGLMDHMPRVEVNIQAFQAPSAKDHPINIVPAAQYENRDFFLTDQAIKTIDQIKDKKFFLYLHFCHPHLPYVPTRNYYDTNDYSSPFDGSVDSLKKLRILGKKRSENDLEHIEELYLSEITETDNLIARLFRYLARQHILDRTTIIFVSDHGDEFYEHGNFNHGLTLYNEVIRIPFFITPSHWDRGPFIYSGRTYLSDIFSNLVTMFDLPDPGPHLNKNSFIRSDGQLNDTLLSREQVPTIFHLELDNRMGYALLDQNYKFIIMQGRAPELYEMDVDIPEARNLAADLPVRVGYYTYLLRRELASIMSSNLYAVIRDNPESDVDIDDLSGKVKDNLKALGYLQ